MARKRSKPVADAIEQHTEAQLHDQATAAHEAQLATAPVEHPLPSDGVPLYPSTPPELIDAPHADPFDAAIAARQAGQFEPPAETHHSEAPQETQQPTFAGREQSRRHGEPKNGVTREQALPNPAPENDIALTAEHHQGPRMRLFRERHPSGHLAAIQFDEKPSDEVRQKLRDAGWQWRQQDAVWKKPLGEQPGLAHYHNQKLFEEIANEIRAANGLEPVTGMGNGRA